MTYNYPMSSEVPMSMPLLPTLAPHLPSRSGARTPPASLNRLARMAPRYGSEMASWKIKSQKVWGGGTLKNTLFGANIIF